MIYEQIVAVANAYAAANITEKQPNLGFTNQPYQKDISTTGWEPGDEWCAAAAILDWYKGYQNRPDILAKVKHLQSLNSQQMANNFHNDPVWKTSTNIPKLGAIVVWQAGNSFTEGHTGIVVSINGNQFTSVEGNTSSPAQPDIREGWTVAAHTHTIGLPHSSLGLNLDRFVYVLESYEPLVLSE